MRGVVGVEAVAGDHRVEDRAATVVLGPQQPAQPLRLLLAGAERAGDLHRHRGFRQVDGEVGHLRDHQRGDLTAPERVEQGLSLGVAGRALDHRGVQLGTELVELVEVGADHQRLLPGVSGKDGLDHRHFGVRRRAQLVALLGLGDGVKHPLVIGHRHPHLDALRGSDPALRLDVLPRGVVALGTDQGKDVALAAVLADQGGRQPQPAPRLQVGCHPEHRRGKQVDLVVDDQAPVTAVEEFEVPVLALGASSDHLICGDGDRPNLLALPRVLADLGFGQRRAGDQFAFPLPARHGVGDQDQGGGCGFGHRRCADDRLAGAAGKHHHARAARPERIGGHLLVVAQLPAVLPQADRVRLAVDVAGQILGGPADLEQHLLDPAALAGMHHHGVLVDALTEHRDDLLVAQHFGQHRAVQADQAQAVGGVFDQLQPAVAGHGVDDVDQQRLRHGVPGECDQGIHHLLGVMAGGAGVPQRQRGDPVGVHVLGSAFEFGERSDRRPRGAGLLVVDLEQHRLVTLDDQWAVGHCRALPVAVMVFIIRGRPT